MRNLRLLQIGRRSQVQVLSSLVEACSLKTVSSKPAMVANIPTTFRRPQCGSEFPGKTELRMGVPDYFYNDDTSSGFANGFGDLTVGFKKQLGPTLGGFDVSVIPARKPSNGRQPDLKSRL